MEWYLLSGLLDVDVFADDGWVVASTIICQYQSYVC